MAEGYLHALLRQLRGLAGGRDAHEVPDRLLLEQFVARRDEAAFAALLARHGPLVLGVCRRVLGNAADAEDAFQATFLILVRKAASLARPEQLGAWLHGVAYRVAVRARANAATRRLHERRAPAPPAADAAEEVAWRDLRPVLDEEVSRLPEKYRVPFVLCHLQGKTNDEAARCLGCPKGTVLSRLARGRERLRKRLLGRGVALPAAALAGALAGEVSSAAVPAALAVATTRAGLCFAAGPPAAGVSAEVAALVEGATKAMLPSKLTLTALVLLVVAAAGAGAAALARRDGGSDAGPPRPAAAVGQAKAGPAADPFGDPLPAGALARMGTRRLREGGGPVAALAFAPDGKTLSSSSPGQAHRWQVVTGKELASWSVARPAEGAVLAFAPDGRTAALVKGDELFLWDLAAGKARHALQGHRGPVRAVAFSPDGRLLASGSGDRTARLWDAATGRELHTLAGHPSAVTALAFSPDGKTLATGAEAVRLWDVATGRRLRPLPGSGKGVAAVAFAPDGRLVAAAGGDRVIRLWDAGEGTELRRLDAGPGAPGALVFAGGGKLLLAADSGGRQRVRRWDMVTGRELPALPDLPDGLTCLAVSADGRTLATAGVDRAIRLWDPVSGKRLRGGEGHLVAAHALAFSPDGKALASAGGAGTGGDHAILLWDTATGGERGRLLPPGGRTTSVLHYAPDGKTLASLTWGSVLLWDPSAWRVRRSIRDQPSPLDFAFAADGQTLATVAGSADLRTRLGRPVPGRVVAAWWDATTGRQVRRLDDAGRAGVSRFGLSADGRTVFVQSDKDGKLHLWDTLTGKERVAFDVPRSAQGVSCAFSPDARLMAWRGPGDTTIRLLETATGKEELRRLVPEGPANVPRGRKRDMRMQFAPDGKTLAAAVGQAIYVWDVATGRERARFRTDQPSVEALAFSRDGRLLATGGGDTTIVVWGVPVRKQ